MRSSQGLGYCFFSYCLLDTHIKLTGESYAWAVNLSENVLIFFLIIPVKDEIGSPDERYFLLIEGWLDTGQFSKEEVNKMLPFFWFVIGVFGSWEKGGWESISSFSWLFVNDKDGFWSNHQNSNLSFLDSGQELHVDKLSLVSNDVLLTESHEFS